MDSILLRFDFDYFKFYLQPALIIVNFRCHYAISYCLFASDSNQLVARMVGNGSLIQPIRHGKTEKSVECAYFFLRYCLSIVKSRISNKQISVYTQIEQIKMSTYPANVSHVNLKRQQNTFSPTKPTRVECFLLFSIYEKLAGFIYHHLIRRTCKKYIRTLWRGSTLLHYYTFP